MPSWDKLNLLSDSPKQEKGVAPSWDKLGVLGTPQNNIKPYTGGIDYNDASSNTVFSDNIIPTDSTPQDNNDFWTPIRNGADELNNTFDNFIKSNPFTSFLARAGQSAADTIVPGGALQDNYDTGSNIGNDIADFAGGMGGFFERLPGTDFSIGNATKAIGQPIENTLDALASKYGLDNKLTDYAINALTGGTELGAYQGLSNAVQGQDIGQGIASGMGQGMLFGAGGKLLGDFVPWLKDNAIQTNTYEDNLANHLVPSTDLTFRQQNGDLVPREGLLGLPEPRGTEAPLNILDNGNEPIIAPPSADEALSLTRNNYLDALDKYNQGIEDVHNYYMTNKLIPEEMQSMKNDLGFDINDLANNLDKTKQQYEGAQNTYGPYVAGVSDAPSLDKVPFDLKQPEINSPTDALNYLKDNTPPKVPDEFAKENPSAPLEKPIESGSVQGDTNTPLTDNTPQNAPNGDLNQPYKYINNQGMDFGGNDPNNLKNTKQDIIDQYVNNKNSNELNVNNLANDTRNGVKNELDLAAGTAYNEAGGDVNKLKAFANSDNPNYDKPYTINGKDTGYTYRQIYERAAELGNDVKDHASNIQQYMNELGQYSNSLGTVDNLRENYMNHMYEKPTLDSMNSLKLEQNKLDALNGKASLNNANTTGTNHNAERVYNSFADAIANGETPKTMNMADLAQTLGNQMASTNATKEFTNGLLNSDIGQAVDRIPDGYSKIAESGGKKIVVPEQLANALRPITEPDVISKYKVAGTFYDLQNNLKTVNLGFSLFHYKNLVLAGLYNGDVKPIAKLVSNLPNIFKMMDDPSFRESEKDFVSNTGMTSMVENNIDTTMKLNSKSTVFNKLKELPGLKQANSLIEGNNKFLFSGVQRFLKVEAYANKVASWMGKNPDATVEQLNIAKKSIAREINGVYGGLNWESLGINKNILKIARGMMLSPDWTYSNIDLAKQAFNRNAGGNAALKSWIGQLLIGGTLLEGLNYATTGHWTGMNPKGHETDVSLGNGIWATPFGGAMGDATKLIGNIATHGGAGVPQFLQGKLAPVLRTGIGMLTNTDFQGGRMYSPKNTPMQDTLNEAKFIGKNLAPVPFATDPITRYLSSGNASVPGALAVGSGLVKYAPDTSNQNNPSAAYTDNWLNKIFNHSPDQQDINSMQDFKSQQLKNNKAASQAMQSAVKNGNNPLDVINQYGLSKKQGQTMQKNAQKQLNNYNQTAIQQQFNKMSATQQKNYLDMLSPEDRQNVLSKVKLKKHH